MEQVLKQRNIQYLVHFTQAENLHNIFKHGLLPRTTLNANKIESHFNFKSRKYHDAIALSIEFVDYIQFNAIRYRQHNLPWVVLCIDASILKRMNCAFSILKGSPLTYGTDAFSALFNEMDDQVSRKTLNLESYLPTSVQSKVLCYDRIPSEYIREVHFQTREDYFIYRLTIPKNAQVAIKIDQKYFVSRHDYEYWKVNSYRKLEE